MKKILFLHGAIGAKSQFDGLIKLLQNDYEIHTLNFSGHGGLELPVTFSIEVFANDVLSYLDKNNIEQIDIFGYSMGGYVALYLAKNYPNKIGKIFTLASKFEWNEEIALKESKMLNPEKISDKIPAFAEILNQRHIPQDWKIVLNKTAEMMIEMGKNNPLNLEDYMDINHDIRISIGDNDNMVSLQETIEVYKTLPNSSFLVMPNTQHPIEKIDNNRLVFELKEWFK